MPSLPSVSGKDAVKAFENAGFSIVRIKGSHYAMKKAGFPLLSVPVHGNKDVAKGTLSSLIKKARLTVDEFIELLRG